MKKKVIIILLVIILLILLFPIRNQLKDGGTIEWKSLTYSIAKVHSIYVEGYPMGYKDGIIIKLFNMTVYNNSNYNLDEEYVIIDTSKNIKDFSCDQALEEIYRDDKYIYYLPCMKSTYIKVIYAPNEYQEGLKVSLGEGRIKINDLDRFNIEYIKKEINNI